MAQACCFIIQFEIRNEKVYRPTYILNNEPQTVSMRAIIPQMTSNGLLMAFLLCVVESLAFLLHCKLQQLSASMLSFHFPWYRYLALHLEYVLMESFTLFLNKITTVALKVI